MLTNLYAVLTAFIFNFTAATRTRVATRGANFVEYALLATIAVVLFLLLRVFASDLIESVFDNIRTALGF